MSRVRHHHRVKTRLLEVFANIGTAIRDDAYHQISNTDHGDTEVWNNYAPIFGPIMKEHIEAVSRIMKPPRPFRLNMPVPWFQQYEKHDIHSWHVHGECNLSSIFYVELPGGTPNTQFSIFGKQFEVNVEEGDILTFPSFYTHCSPSSKSEKRKSIISFNWDIC